MQPSAPPYYSITHSSDLKIDSVQDDQIKSSFIKQNLLPKPDFDKNNSEGKDRNSTEKQNIKYLSDSGSTGIKDSNHCKNKEIRNSSSKYNCRPYDKCFTQLSEMNPSTYENVARFHEQQRQIASEIEANKCLYGKGSSPTHNCCLQNRSNHINGVGKIEGDSCFTNPQFENKTLPAPKLTGK